MPEDLRSALQPPHAYLHPLRSGRFDPAMPRAAEYYANGLGVKKSVPTAMEWFRKATKGGDVYAQFDLGTRYEFGGPYWKKSVEESLYWYRVAA